MPTIYTENGFIFYFYSGDRQESIHIHIDKAEGSAKIWIEPTIKWAYCYGFKANQKRQIMEIVKKNSEFIKNKWHEHFSQN